MRQASLMSFAYPSKEACGRLLWHGRISVLYGREKKLALEPGKGDAITSLVATCFTATTLVHLKDAEGSTTPLVDGRSEEVRKRLAEDEGETLNATDAADVVVVFRQFFYVDNVSSGEEQVVNVQDGGPEGSHLQNQKAVEG